MNNNNSLNNITKKADAAVEAELEAKSSNRFSKIFFAVLLITLIFTVIFACVYIKDELDAEIDALYSSIKGKTFTFDYDSAYDNYGKEIELKSRDGKHHYKFYGIRFTLVFNEDETVTWSRQFDRKSSGDVWTDPITTTESYEVIRVEKGIFRIKLQDGEIFHCIDSINPITHKPQVERIYLYSHNLISAPDELANMETSIIPSTSSSGTSSSSSSRKPSNSYTRPACSGGSVACRDGWSPCHEMKNGFCNQCCKD